MGGATPYDEKGEYGVGVGWNIALAVDVPALWESWGWSWSWRSFVVAAARARWRRQAISLEFCSVRALARHFRLASLSLHAATRFPSSISCDPREWGSDQGKQALPIEVETILRLFYCLVFYVTRVAVLRRERSTRWCSGFICLALAADSSMLDAWVLATYLAPPLLHRRSDQQIENVSIHSAWKPQLPEVCCGLAWPGSFLSAVAVCLLC
jgi:hypothetical protein